jgi:hypothetical protein
LGISGFFSRLKDKGTLVKETWGTISTAIDAQMTMEEMAKLEEKGGDEWTDEKKAEYERKVTGKILAAAWRGSKFEIQSVLRWHLMLLLPRNHPDMSIETFVIRHSMTKPFP